MPYCSNCGTEYDLGDSFCAECGKDLDESIEVEPEPEPEHDTEAETPTPPKETGTCEKCDSEISLEADKCPECGYEPASQGIIGSLLLTLSVGASILLAGLILIIWIVAIAGSFSITGAVTLTAFFGVILLIPLGIIYLGMKKEMNTPTGEKKSLKEEVLGDD